MIVMERNLASIQKIISLELIPNADKIELATILGWKSVVKKGDFKVGDSVVYFEIDSFLPIRPEFEFLRKNCLRKNNDGVEGFRLKTIRLKGQISQGLIMPITILDGIRLSTDIRTEAIPNYKWSEGQNVSKLLDVIQWQPIIPLCLSGIMKGGFPVFLPKTDETRVQLLQGLITKYKGINCYITEKVDGSSATYYLKDGVFGVCSRNLELLESESNIFWKMARKLKIEEKMRTHKLDNIALQGELCGPGIQENSLKLKDFDIYFFNFYNIKTGEYVNWDEMNEYLGILGLKSVSLIDYSFVLIDDIDKLVNYAKIKSTINPNGWAEGIVIRPRHEIDDREFMNVLNHDRVSFKVINPEYLIDVEK